jgi:hypothetical protein
MDLLQNTTALSSFLESSFSAPVESLEIDTCVLLGLSYQMLMTTKTIVLDSWHDRRVQEDILLNAIQATLEASLSTELRAIFDNQTTAVIFRSSFSLPSRGENLTKWIELYHIDRVCFSTVPPPVQDQNGRLINKIQQWARTHNIQAALDANPDTQDVDVSEFAYVSGAPSESKGLSTGAIVVIVIACVGVVLVVALLIYTYSYRKQCPSSRAAPGAGKAATIGIEADTMQPDSLKLAAPKTDNVLEPLEAVETEGTQSDPPKSIAPKPDLATAEEGRVPYPLEGVTSDEVRKDANT